MGKEKMKFACQSSCGGRCCSQSWRDDSPHVFLTRGDQYRLSSFLDRPLEVFAERAAFETTRFSKEPTVQWILKLDQGRCKFLNEGKCGVYSARPTQCRTYPYWPEHMKGQEFSKEVKESCPGVGHGTDVWAKGLLAAQREADRELSGNVWKSDS